MTIDAYDFVHLALDAVSGEIKGKTKLQKTVYFLGVLTKTIDPLGYRAHYYGPYSQDVADACSRLKALGFVDQNMRGGGVAGEGGFEVTRYDFCLTKSGRKVAEIKKKKSPDLAAELRKAWGKLQDAGDVGYMKMSVAAKMHFLLEKRSRASTEELVKFARRFGWKVTETEVDEAGKYLEKLDLVTVDQ